MNIKQILIEKEKYLKNKENLKEEEFEKIGKTMQVKDRMNFCRSLF